MKLQGRPKRAKDYAHAIKFIALNDNPGDNDDSNTLRGYASVVLVSELYDVPQDIVAEDVWTVRVNKLSPESQAIAVRLLQASSMDVIIKTWLSSLYNVIYTHDKLYFHAAAVREALVDKLSFVKVQKVIGYKHGMTLYFMLDNREHQLKMTENKTNFNFQFI